jgi:hypothetical protein
VSHFNALAVVGRKFMDFLSPVTVGTAGPVTYTPAQFASGMIIRDCAGAARSDTTPTAAQIIDGMTVSGRAPVVGNYYELYLRNTSAGAFAVTLLAGANVILAGTMIVPQSQTGKYLVTVGNAGIVTVTCVGIGAH